MKKILLLFTILLSLNLGFSQSLFILDSVLTIASPNVNATDLYAKTYLVNNSGQTLNVNYTFNGGNPISSLWEVGFCTDAACDNPSIVTSGSFSMDDGDSVEVKITVLPMGNSDDLTGQVSFNAVGTTLDRVNLAYDLKVGVVGIKDLDTKSLSIFPNPATNFIQINGFQNTKDVHSIEVYNIIGSKVAQKQVSSISDLRMDIQNLENGIYLVKLFDNSQKVFYTRTFVKK